MPWRRQRACSSRETRSRSLGWGRYVASWAAAEPRGRPRQVAPAELGGVQLAQVDRSVRDGVADRVDAGEELRPDHRGPHVGAVRGPERGVGLGPGEQVGARRERRRQGSQQPVLGDEEGCAGGGRVRVGGGADRGVVPGRQRPGTPAPRARRATPAATRVAGRSTGSAAPGGLTTTTRAGSRCWSTSVTAAATLAWVASTATRRSASGLAAAHVDERGRAVREQRPDAGS